MSYAKEFDFENYNVPNCLINSDWEDVSWHNDVCPRWENYKLMIAVWVERMDCEQRELEDQKQYTVCEILSHGGDDYYLADGTLFSTEYEDVLEQWLWLYYAKCQLEYASSAFCSMDEPIEELQDGIATLLAKTDEAMDSLHDQEIHDCSPSGEPC